MRITDKILNLIYPPVCPFCGEITGADMPVCRKCMDTLPFSRGYNCRICSRPLGEYAVDMCSSCRKEKPAFIHAFIPLIYKANVRRALLNMKNHSHPYYAKAFAFLLANDILSSGEYAEFDYITFVPQSRANKRQRGYNHAELIARQLGKYLNVKCIPTLLRTNDGLPQHLLSAPERRENVKKCFFKGEGTFSGTVLLVDDIYTTGSTANHCSKLLRKMGFEKVYVAVTSTRIDDDYEKYEKKDN